MPAGESPYRVKALESLFRRLIQHLCGSRVSTGTFAAVCSHSRLLLSSKRSAWVSGGLYRQGQEDRELTRIVYLGTKRSEAIIFAQLKLAALASSNFFMRSAPGPSSKPPKTCFLDAVMRSRPGTASKNPAGNSGCLPGPGRPTQSFKGWPSCGRGRWGLSSASAVIEPCCRF